MPKCIDKTAALAEGRRYYFGRPCRKCGSNKRNMSSGNCMACGNQRYTAAMLSDWRKRNPEKAKAILRRAALKRKAASSNSIPKWLTEHDSNLINEMHANTPDGYELDHIVPLVSDRVCGLHVPWNLQYLTIRENRAKSNRWWPDMFEKDTATTQTE